MCVFFFISPNLVSSSSSLSLLASICHVSIKFPKIFSLIIYSRNFNSFFLMLCISTVFMSQLPCSVHIFLNIFKHSLSNTSTDFMYQFSNIVLFLTRFSCFLRIFLVFVKHYSLCQCTPPPDFNFALPHSC